ncbi:MAG TPA: cytochrome c [Candidatus Angelobacter sp.]
MRRIASILLLAVFPLLLAGCSKDPDQQTDAELGLNAGQAHGRRVYKVYCAVCHTAYSSRAGKGPSLQGLYRKQYLPSGLIANDRFVEQTIVRGRNMMPSLGNSLSQKDVEDLIAYLHSL